MSSLNTVLQLLGGVTAISTIYKISSFLWLYLRPSSLDKYHHGKPGSKWALVTGASDGIGYGFVESLLSSGFNVLLHGRNLEKLSRIKDALTKTHPNLSIRIVVADAFDASPDDIAQIVSTAQTLPGKLTVLVNNVGGAPVKPLFAPLAEQDSAHVDKHLNLNARFPAQLTRALLPLLIANGPSLVLNMTSGVALRGLPFLTTYSCSKAFNYTFSECLRAEMRAAAHDVEVLGIIIGNVKSASNKVVYRGVTCSSLELAREALSRVGCGRANVWAWWRHALQWGALAWVPDGVLEGQLIKALIARKAAEEHQKGE